MQSVRISLLGATLLALSVGLGGCKSAKDKKGETGETNQPAQPDSKKPDSKKPDAEKPDSARPAKQPAKPITEKEVQELLHIWLEAQNKGAFATYEPLYAKRLEGIRRSGSKTVRLDRKGWVKERKRMFKRSMKVEMSDIDIDIFTQSAIATFTQRWASGSYEDVGPKQLVLVREGNGLRIAREEMLTSTLIGGGKKTALANHSFVFIVEAGGTQYAVLDQLGSVPTGALTLRDKGDPVAVEAAVEAGKLPSGLTGWQGQELTNGECEATIGDIVALSRVVPHFGERQTWSGEFDDSEPYTDEQIAQAAFHDSSTYLVGRLQGSCKLGAYASVVSKPAPLIGKEMADGPRKQAIVAAAEKAFRQLASYKQLQKEFKDFSDTGAWEDYGEEDADRRGSLGVTVTEHPTKGTVQVLAQAHAGMGCGDFEGSLTAHFAVKGTPEKPKVELVHESLSHPRVLAIIDVEGDGVLEYLFEEFSITVLRSWKGDERQSVAVAFFDCGC